jgi:heme/copper-type cytochrome/quinol oxidase subunit 3
LAICLTLTVVGGFGFMAIKAVEYKTKWEHHLGVGQANRFDPRFKGPEKLSPGTEGSVSGAATGETGMSGSAAQGSGAGGSGSDHPKKPGEEQAKAAAPQKPLDLPPDPNAGTPDAAKIRPLAAPPSGLALAPPHHRERGGHFNEQEAEAAYRTLPVLDQRRVATFFQVYFLMTGLHGLHVLIGMALIFWILLRAVTPSTRRWLLPVGGVTIGLFLVYLGILVPHRTTLLVGLGITLLMTAGTGLQYARSKHVASTAAHEFGPKYFTPVDIVGLYWHLVDLIWIFLFPLLYLIE